MYSTKEELIARMDNGEHCLKCDKRLDDSEMESTEYCSPSCLVADKLGVEESFLKQEYSDRKDASLDISLGEYGFIRCPKTDDVIWLDSGGEVTQSAVTPDEVKEKLTGALNSQERTHLSK